MKTDDGVQHKIVVNISTDACEVLKEILVNLNLKNPEEYRLRIEAKGASQSLKYLQLESLWIMNVKKKFQF